MAREYLVAMTSVKFGLALAVILACAIVFMGNNAALIPAFYLARMVHPNSDSSCSSCYPLALTDAPENLTTEVTESTVDVHKHGKGARIAHVLYVHNRELADACGLLWEEGGIMSICWGSGLAVTLIVPDASRELAVEIIRKAKARGELPNVELLSTDL